MTRIRLVPLFVAILATLSFAIPKGMQVQVLKEGQGAAVQSGARVKVHYTGWLPDSTKFDSSRDRGEPLEFPLGAGMVIAGWDQGLVGMKAGEVRRLVIPPELGYGDRSVGPIPANSSLIFEVELISFEKGMEGDAFPSKPEAFAWKTTSPGVEVYDQTVGQGTPARPGTKIQLHFTGWLTGGTMFGSSKTTGKPFEVVLGTNKLIRGWEQGLEGVQAGGVRWLRVQPSAGYGSAAMARIPPNSVLLYRVEALSVEADEVAQGVDFFPDVANLKLQESREGLKMAVIVPPTDTAAAPAQVGKKVKVQYTGWLLDGTMFDSSRSRSDPFEFSLGAGRVIRGWDLGVEGMRPGEKRVLVIPPGLGYGSRGAGPIPAGATLVFIVECVGT